MRVDLRLAFGPFKDREAPILRCHECHGFTLILDELRRREVSSAAKLIRMDYGGCRTFDRLRHRDLLDRWPALAPSDFSAKTEQLMLIGEHHGAIDCGQACDRIHCPT